MFWVPYSFKIWIAILKGREFLKAVAFSGSRFGICGLHLFGSEWEPMMYCSKETD
jgi:hypothetical protein